MTTIDTISEARVDLRSAGTLIDRSDPDYDTARAVYNAMIDRSPGLIVQVGSHDEVVAAVNAARRHRLPLAIRGGGHNGAGLGIVDDGLGGWCFSRGVDRGSGAAP